jgi:hypothetical protein
MYEIYPGTEGSNFRCITSWQVPYGSYILAYSSRHIVVCDDCDIDVYALTNIGTGGPQRVRLRWRNGNTSMHVSSNRFARLTLVNNREGHHSGR